MLKSCWQNSLITCRHTPHGVQKSVPLRSVGAPTIAIAVKSLYPSLIAFAKAVRSAHILGEKAPFSMLQPLNTLPSAHSRAAPTLKCEAHRHSDELPVPGILSLCNPFQGTKLLISVRKCKFFCIFRTRVISTEGKRYKKVIRNIKKRNRPKSELMLSGGIVN